MANLRVVKRVLLAAAAFVVALALGAPARAAAVTPFREVAAVKNLWYVQSDGVRYAWAKYWRNPAEDEIGVVVFDTVRGRKFRLADPAPGCSFVSIGGGLALWSCYQPRRVFLTNLSTGRSHQPVGIDQVWQRAAPGSSCYTLGDVGRYWLGFACGNGFGPGDAPFYLNHRTGRLIPEFDQFASELPFIDPDYVDLFRLYCAPLERPTGLMRRRTSTMRPRLHSTHPRRGSGSNRSSCSAVAPSAPRPSAVVGSLTAKRRSSAAAT